MTTENHGTKTSSTAEQSLWDLTTGQPTNYEAYINLKNLVSGDQIIIRQYTWDAEIGAYALYETQSYTFTGTPAKPHILLPWIITTHYKVTIQMAVGVRVVTWTRYDS
jgi:hypothetical protein